MLYNIDFGIAGIIFLTIYYFFLKTQFSTNIPSNLRFRHQVLTILLANIMDVITAITISYPYSVPLWVNYLLNTILFFAVGLTGYMMPLYINYLLYREAKRKTLDWINMGILGVYLLLCVINPFTKIMFFFDESRKYTAGPLYIVMFVMPYIFMTEAVIRVLILRKRLSRKQLISVIAFSFIASVGAISQMLWFRDVLLSYFFIAVAAVVLLFSFETPDYQKLVKTTEDLKETQKNLEKAREKEEKSTRVIYELMRTSSWKLEYFPDSLEVATSYWSPEFKIMLGVEDVTDISEADLWVNALHPEDREAAVDAFFGGLKGEKSFDMEYRMKDKTGEYRWYRGTGETTVDNESGLAIYQGIIQDINDEKEKEKLSLERAEALEDLQKSQKALRRALEEAQEANQAKSRFLSNMSHDIRTPMNAIVGFTDLAIESVDDKEKVAECLDKIQISGNHLLLLINDILDMSRIESGKVNIELAPANIADIMHELGNMFEGQAKSKNLDFSIDVSEVRDANVICDRLRLNQVLLNCVGNSVKFTPEGGSIAVQVQQLPSMEPGKADYGIIIADTGIGMSKKFLEHIFEPFEREKTSTISKTQGTGLGMAITKSLVELMDGTIAVESREGEGTTYMITLTLEIAGGNSEYGIYVPKEEEVTIEDMMEFLKGKHFLLVDDNSTNRMLARGVLGAKGMTCEEADDGTVAVERMLCAKPGEFDMILMDVQMPIMDGYAATDRIRKMDDPVISQIPILAMTANAFEEDKQECIAHGMNGHLAKPFKPDDLVRKLYNCLTS